MTFLEFDAYQATLIDQVVRMKDTKGMEYANSESRFANFDRLGIRLNIDRLKVGLIFLTKHMDAIESYISRGRTYSTETIEGRIVDAITYLTLIAGMIKELEQQPETQARIISLDNISESEIARIRETLDTISDEIRRDAELRKVENNASL